MRILLITTFYAPDPAPSAAQFAVLCEGLVRLGYEVSVISAVPHYPSGRVWPEFRGRLVQREDRNGVAVTRVWVPSVNRARLGLRLITFIAYQLLATLAGLRRRYDLLAVSNPALESLLPFLVLGTLRRKPSIFSVHDLYPDVGIKLGIFRHDFLARLVGGMEQLCLKRATCVRVLSENFRRSLESRGVPGSRIALVWDWVDTDFVRPQPRVNAFSARWQLDACFTVLYVGNIGLSQGLEGVLEAARLLADKRQIRFVFVGDGAGKKPLVTLAGRMALHNVQFIPFQPRELLPLVLASADVCLVSLRRGVGEDSVPSKFYSILASGRPLIASIDAGSDTWNLTRQAACGISVPPEDPQALAAAVLRLYHDESYRAACGAQGRAFVERYHSGKVAAQAFDQLLGRLPPNVPSQRYLEARATSFEKQ